MFRSCNLIHVEDVCALFSGGWCVCPVLTSQCCYDMIVNKVIKCVGFCGVYVWSGIEIVLSVLF